MTFPSKAQNCVVNYFAFTHLLIAAGAGVCVYTTGVVLGDAENFIDPSLFIAMCTGLGYTVQRLLKMKISPSSMPVERLIFLRSWGGWLLALWGVSVLAGALWLDLVWGVAGIAGVTVIGILGLGYAMVPKNWVHRMKALREVPGLKLPLLSVVWGAATVVLPWMLTGATEWASGLFTITVARTLYIAGLTIPFDLRDADLDNPSMKTLGQTLNPRYTVILAASLVILSGILWISINQIWLAFHSLFTASIVLLSRKNAPEFFYSIILDGLLVVQLFGLL
jgi:hypothetical protein